MTMRHLKMMIAVAIAGILLIGCGIYDKYESKATIPGDVIGLEASSGETSVSEVISWREFFTDPLLQELIDSTLARNTDLNSARIAVEMSEASLQAARMAYLPSLYFSPSGTVTRFDNTRGRKPTICPFSCRWTSMPSVQSLRRSASQRLC